MARRPTEYTTWRLSACDAGRGLGSGSASGVHTLDHTLLAQRCDLIFGIAELGHDLVGVLAQGRRAMADRARRVREKHRRLGERCRLRGAGKAQLLQKFHGVPLWVRERLLRL